MPSEEIIEKLIWYYSFLTEETKGMKYI